MIHGRYCDHFFWDWATPSTGSGQAGVPEMLSAGDALYLVGHETLGQWDGAWTYYLPDALGSVRQATDGAGAVVSAREWSPYGVEVSAAQGAPQAGLGYTGEWFDGDVGMVYLRARWYDVDVGRFTRRDPWEGTQDEPQTLHAYVYVRDNVVNFTDPSGKWREPTPDEVASVNLDEIWTASRKPRCCYLYEGICDNICVGRQRAGVPIDPDRHQFDNATNICDTGWRGSTRPIHASTANTLTAWELRWRCLTCMPGLPVSSQP